MSTMSQSPGRTVADSEVTLAQVMLPEDANPQGNVHGGTLMKLADNAGGTVAARHARSRVVTVVMDCMTFLQPVFVGDLLLLNARATWVGTSSIEVEVSIEAEDILSGTRRHTSTAFFVYVALDADGKPRPIPPLVLHSDDERERWAAAERRRAHRLEQRHYARKAVQQ
jgi:acyl-CoA hydrolase